MASELTACDVKKLSLFYRDAEFTRDVHRRCTKAIAAAYLQRFRDLDRFPNFYDDDDRLIACMISDYSSLRKCKFFNNYIKAMLCYQRNAQVSLGYMIYS